MTHRQVLLIPEYFYFKKYSRRRIRCGLRLVTHVQTRKAILFPSLVKTKHQFPQTEQTEWRFVSGSGGTLRMRRADFRCAVIGFPLAVFLESRCLAKSSRKSKTANSERTTANYTREKHQRIDSFADRIRVY